METVWWLLGYLDTYEADERQKNLKHLLMKQVRDSKLVLKPVEQVKVNNNICKYKFKKPKPIRKTRAMKLNKIKK